jgi:hypothetical protein
MSEYSDKSDQRCLICKYSCYISGKNHIGKARFYLNAKNFISVALCLLHDRELFILGQINFLRKYRLIGRDFFEVDSDYKQLQLLFDLLDKRESHEYYWKLNRIGYGNV